MGGSSASKQAPRLPSYESGKVYLFTIPTLAWIPCMSPFGLKLETWLRAKKVDYEAVRSLNNQSAKGQVPFVEIDGEEINDSTLVIQELSRRLQREDELTDEQKAVGRAVSIMMDNHTFWTVAYHRMTAQSREFFESVTFVGGMKKTLMKYFASHYITKRAREHGIGRNSPEEILQLGKDDIRALSDILGGKRYLFGDNITSADCAVFGHMAQFMYAPFTSPHKEFTQTEAPNLAKYVDRMRDTLWPDWDELCQQQQQQQQEQQQEKKQEQ